MTFEKIVSDKLIIEGKIFVNQLSWEDLDQCAIRFANNQSNVLMAKIFEWWGLIENPEERKAFENHFEIVKHTRGEINNEKSNS